MDPEIMTHEFTHLIVGATSKLQGTFQPGALNESYADIMAVVMDREAGDLNWTQGENRTSGAGQVRNLQDPTKSAISTGFRHPI